MKTIVDRAALMGHMGQSVTLRALLGVTIVGARRGAGAGNVTTVAAAFAMGLTRTLTNVHAIALRAVAALHARREGHECSSRQLQHNRRLLVGVQTLKSQTKSIKRACEPATRRHITHQIDVKVR